MMNNFYEYIEKDIEAKKNLISSLPTRTKTNIKKFNSTIDTVREKYSLYKNNVKKYLLAKHKSFTIKEEEKNLEKLNDKVSSLQNIMFLLNPLNTYVEKMGFDTLLYEINRYYIFSFDFEFFNEIINGFLDKFDLAGIKLTTDDFNYTCYVHEYMSSFLEVRYSKEKKYSKVSEIFEKIYWINPEIIEHIELNFRRLIRDNAKKFESYISSLQKDILKQNNISNYEECVQKYKEAYEELQEKSGEDLYSIAQLALNNNFDINQYLETSKVRKAAYDSLIPSDIDTNSEREMFKICTILDKLKINLQEYNNYLDFSGLFNSFKEEYSKLLSSETKVALNTKKLEEDIREKEKKLDKLNKRILSDKKSFLDSKNENDIKVLKTDSVKLAKELHTLYMKFDKEYFKEKVLSKLNSSMTILDVLNLYYSFDYFKRSALESVYNLNQYKELIRINNNFDSFAKNPTNVIISGANIFEENNLAKVIANKYRLNNLNIVENDLSPENLKSLLNKILLILRVNKVENSSSSIEKIWFMVQINKINASEETENN